MSRRISLLIFAVVLASCTQEQVNVTEPAQTPYLLEAEELRTIASRENIKLLDFRKSAVYANEHIPGAENVRRSDIEDSGFDYGGMMASKGHIESLFSALGIATVDTIVIYDDNGLCNAARLWWILQNYDFENVRLLHGGIEAWKTAGGIVTDLVPAREKSIFALTDDPGMNYYLSKEDVRSALDSNTVIIDTRSIDEFTGKRQKSGAAKAGRIPGSRHIDWADAIDYEGDKRMKSHAELELIYGALGIAKHTPIIVYCHSGVRSAHTTFVLTQLLGFENVKNYDGSWTEWSQFDDLPVERDAVTIIEQ